MEKLASSWMRKIAVLVCAVLLACCCGLLAGCGENDEQAVRNLVTNEFNSVKNLDSEAIEEIAGETSALDGLDAYGITATDAYEAIFNGFDYKIESIKVDGDTATVGIVFTTKDLADFENALVAAAQKAYTDGTFTANMTANELNKAIGKLVIDTLKELPMKQTNEVTFECVKTDGEWNFSDDAGTVLQEALFPSSVMNSMQ